MANARQSRGKTKRERMAGGKRKKERNAVLADARGRVAAGSRNRVHAHRLQVVVYVLFWFLRPALFLLLAFAPPASPAYSALRFSICVSP